MFLRENEMVNSTKVLRIESEMKRAKQYLMLCEDEQKLFYSKVLVEKANKKSVEKANEKSVEKACGALQGMVKELEKRKEEFEREMDLWRVFKQIKTHYGVEK